MVYILWLNQSLNLLSIQAAPRDFHNCPIMLATMSKAAGELLVPSHHINACSQVD